MLSVMENVFRKAAQRILGQKQCAVMLSITIYLRCAEFALDYFWLFKKRPALYTSLLTHEVILLSFKYYVCGLDIQT